MFNLSIADQNDMLIKSAHFDVQTELPNTYGFIDSVNQIESTKDITEYNAYYIDIVRMGRLNTMYGKTLGDEIIVKYAKFLIYEAKDNLDLVYSFLKSQIQKC